MRKKGVLQSFHANGYGMVSVDGQLYFLHRTSIANGEPMVGSVVEFDIAPARGNGKFEQATNAVIVPPQAVEAVRQ